MKYREKKIECGRGGCGNPRRANQRTCRACHAADQRSYRAQRVYVKKDAQ